MPGVPTSRGCDACRKRKKKCDAEANDRCSWCHKHNIPCVGGRQQRYNFKDEGPKLKQRYPEIYSLSRKATSGPAIGSRPALTATLAQEPINDLDRLTRAFADKASMSIDINHQLVMNFGGFLREVPKRLGTNEALDAAAGVLVAAHTNYSAGHLNVDSKTLVSHSCALNALTKCLNDPVQARSPEALCAVMLLSICQVLMRNPMTSASHYLGASQMFKNRGYSGPRDEFDRVMLHTFRAPVAIEALFDSRIHFTDEEWECLAVRDLDNGTTDGDLMVCVCRLPNLINKAREIIGNYQSLKLSNFDALDVQSGLLDLQMAFQPVLQRLQDRWEDTARTYTAGSMTAEAKRLVHCHHARMLAFGLGIGILINTIRIRLRIDDNTTVVRIDNARMSRRILDLAEVLLVYRPLGSMLISLFLGAALVGATDPIIKARIEAIGLIYSEDLCGIDDKVWARDYMHLTASQFDFPWITMRKAGVT